MTTHEAYVLEFEKRRKKILDIYDDLRKNEYTNVSSRDDARLTLLLKCVETLTNLQIGLMNIFNLAKDPEWIKNYPFDIRINESDVRYIHEMFFKIGFIHIYFSSIESSLRIFLKNIDPSACNNSTAEFQSIYKALFKRLNLQQYDPLLNLFRCIRNTIHNNGVFNPPSNTDEHIEYDGKKYDFIVGKPQSSTSWKDLLSIIDYTIPFMEDVLMNSTIKSIPHMNDPLTSQVWPQYNPK